MAFFLDEDVDETVTDDDAAGDENRAQSMEESRDNATRVPGSGKSTPWATKSGVNVRIDNTVDGGETGLCRDRGA